jgi:hypothetical protein
MGFEIFLEFAFLPEAFPSNDVSRDQDNVACANGVEPESSFTFSSRLGGSRKCLGEQFYNKVRPLSAYTSTLRVDFA